MVNKPVTTSLCRLKTATGMYGRRMSQTLRLKSSSWAQLDKWYIHWGRHLTRAVDAIDCTVNTGVSMCRWSALESNTCQSQTAHGSRQYNPMPPRNLDTYYHYHYYCGHFKVAVKTSSTGYSIHDIQYCGWHLTVLKSLVWRRIK